LEHNDSPSNKKLPINFLWRSGLSKTHRESIWYIINISLARNWKFRKVKWVFSKRESFKGNQSKLKNWDIWISKSKAIFFTFWKFVPKKIKRVQRTPLSKHISSLLREGQRNFFTNQVSSKLVYMYVFWNFGFLTKKLLINYQNLHIHGCNRSLKKILILNLLQDHSLEVRLKIIVSVIDCRYDHKMLKENSEVFSW